MRSYKQEMGKLETDFVSQIAPFVVLTGLHTGFHVVFIVAPTHLGQH